MKQRILGVATAAMLAASFALADDDDPPGRAARLSYISGTVSFQPGSVEDWVPATLNRPMTTGDRLWTEAGARAEVHLGTAAIRLNGRTNFTFLNLDDRITQIQVSVGTVSVRLRRLDEDESFEIDTPQLAMTLLRAGEYRVDVNEQGDTTIVGVRGGDAQVSSGSQAITLHARDQLRAMGTDAPVLDTRMIPPADPFDNWCQERDRREDMSESGRHMSRDIPGYWDLDGAGVWTEYPDYGWVWRPRVVIADWAPYRFGHWAWIAPWGWTWVDDAPWGYAPFHYGRWVFAGGGWVWVPGPSVPRPVFAPALVAWVGGATWGVSIGIGVGPAVGWFPLGPREVWVPAFHCSPVYLERVNVTNTVIVNRTVIHNINVTNINYVNRNAPNAVTAVPQSAMATGRPVRTVAVRVPPEAVSRAQVQTMAAVAPERTAVLGARVQASAAPPAAVVNRQVVVRQAPPSPPPSFAQQREALRQNPGQPIPRSAVSQLPPAPARGGGQGSAQRPSFRRVGPPAEAPSAPSGVQPQIVRPSGQPPQQQPPSRQPEFRREPAEAAPPGRGPQPQIRREPPVQREPQIQRQPPPQRQPEVQRPAPAQREPQVQREPQRQGRGSSSGGQPPPRGREREDGKGRSER